MFAKALPEGVRWCAYCGVVAAAARCATNSSGERAPSRPLPPPTVTPGCQAILRRLSVSSDSLRAWPISAVKGVMFALGVVGTGVFRGPGENDLGGWAAGGLGGIQGPPATARSAPWARLSVGPKLISGMSTLDLPEPESDAAVSPTVFNTPARGLSLDSCVSVDFRVLA